VLEGSVRKSGNRVRITAQLIEADRDVHMWSETYDRELNDIFAIQDEIAHKVAQALRITLLGEDEARLDQVASTEINAYDLYLKGLQGVNEGGFVSLDRAANLFQEALTLDPYYTPAKIGLVNSWVLMANTGSISNQQALDRGLPLLEQILEDQPGNSAARFQMAALKVLQGDKAAAEKAFTEALDDDPRNADGLKQYGRFLFNNRRIEQAMELINAAVEIDPYSVRVLWEQCQTNAYLQRVEIALAACERIKEIEPESPSGWYGWGLTHSLNGDMARASYGFTEAIKRDPGDYEMIAAMSFYWVTMGDAEQAEQWLERAEAIGAGQPFPLIARLRLLKYREQHDRARDLARRALAQNIENRHGSDWVLKQTWAYESSRAGDFQAALEPLRASLPWAFEPELVLPDDFSFQTNRAILVAALLRMTDPTSERPEQLLKAAENSPDHQHPAWGVWSSDLDKAAIATVRGDYETALEWLNSAWDKNWRFMWRETLVEDAIFSQLKNEPGYKELVARFEADMEQQRELAYELLEVER
jgi:tetratricopeptide (TPR) repeat protein